METELTNAQIAEYTIKLADKIPGDKYSGLYPVPMGGFPVAIELSRLLNIPI